jgi:DNA-binding transcriptional ArsR family regulator
MSEAENNQDRLKGNDPLDSALRWDHGTAYEILLSTNTMMQPKAHGLSAPWAAGVRKRLSPQSQADFKNFFGPAFGIFNYTPLHLVHEMDHPKTVSRFLDYVEAIPDEDFPRRAHYPIFEESTTLRIIERVLDHEAVSEEEIEEYRRAVGKSRIMSPPSTSDMHRLLDEMRHPGETKRRWLALMREYQAVFFASEEARLGPVLEKTLEDARALSRKLSTVDLIERLSNGYTISEESDLEELILVPSIWSHPFVVPLKLAPRQLLLAWGTRPPGYRLAPGETVPDQALLVLRALADPTRLRLLRLLATEPRTPQALARELKLTLPTVSHHMRELRVAGLVRMEAQVQDRGRENRYAVRWQAAERAFSELGRFVTVDGIRDS